MITLQQVTDEPRDTDAAAAVAAVRAGDLLALTRALEARPSLVAERVPGYGGRTLLHIVADWPGYTPRGPQVVRLLIERGADPNVRGDDDEHGESPLHWAASSDDVDVARALLDGGADMELPGGSIGTPLDNAIGYGCWQVAELLARRGARIEKLWHAAALGRLDFWQAYSPTRPTTTRSPKRFGTPAPRRNVEPPSVYCRQVRTSIGPRTMPRARRWTPQPTDRPGSRTSLSG